ncbi:hypothetical protein PHK61_25810 [Actinomycetospora lutea]|uniref:hypothetical protein n=1 Tax=Actinomycetospora lutea TaxID=663604 RepID=UPI002365CF15|nr:hypothetical protein [Actinomycetospora lutea]MDD7941839.1 hypothetical protein [Actinomycetospora lutea]
MLREPSSSPLAPPAGAPDTLPASFGPPSDLRGLARRAHRDPGAARELAAALLARGWSTRPVAALAGLAESAVAALARVRRPGTAAGAVADDLAARARRRSAGTEELPPAPRRPASA